MKNTKRTAIAAVIFLSVAVTPLPSFASGIPVVDVGAIAQAMQQVKYLQQQLTQMKNQLDSMNGDRGMAGLLSGQNRNYLPTDWNSAMNVLNSGGGGSFGSLASAAQQIKQAQSVLSSFRSEVGYRRKCSSILTRCGTSRPPNRHWDNKPTQRPASA